MSTSHVEKTFGPPRSESDVDLPASIKDRTSAPPCISLSNRFTQRSEHRSRGLSEFADIYAATNGCMLVVRADVYTPRPDKATWYNIWAAATAVRKLCVMKGQAGQAVEMGTSS